MIELCGKDTGGCEDDVFLWCFCFFYVCMRPVYKSDLARAAGVSSQTMRRWCREHERELEMRFTPRCAKILHPLAVRYLCRHYCIEL